MWTVSDVKTTIYKCFPFLEGSPVLTTIVQPLNLIEPSTAPELGKMSKLPKLVCLRLEAGLRIVKHQNFLCDI